MARLDVLEVAKAQIMAAGMSPVVTSLADSMRHPEAVILSPGVPTAHKRYWDGSGSTSMRITVIVKRVSEERAVADAAEAARVMRREKGMESQNGSYRLVSCDAEHPRFLQWDPQGRYLYAFDATVIFEEL